MDAEHYGPFQDFTLEEIIDYIEALERIEPLIIAVKQLDELNKLPPELHDLWEGIDSYLRSPSLGAVPQEAIQGVNGEEPSEDSQPPPGAPPATSAMLTDQTRGVEAAVPAAAAGSQFFCCVLTAAGYSTIRITYDSYRIFARAHCRARQGQLHPHRTMRLRDGRC
jgi:hypothetical protein